ncbi:unnamed protein product [Peniophora sp. CBMAI 1063]|nr:unnamed protein product [Peniophora sp. CBMAI 1063]
MHPIRLISLRRNGTSKRGGRDYPDRKDGSGAQKLWSRKQAERIKVERTAVCRLGGKRTRPPCPKVCASAVASPDVEEFSAQRLVCRRARDDDDENCPLLHLHHQSRHLDAHSPQTEATQRHARFKKETRLRSTYGRQTSRYHCNASNTDATALFPCDAHPGRGQDSPAPVDGAPPAIDDTVKITGLAHSSQSSWLVGRCASNPGHSASTPQIEDIASSHSPNFQSLPHPPSNRRHQLALVPLPLHRAERFTVPFSKALALCGSACSSLHSSPAAVEAGAPPLRIDDMSILFVQRPCYGTGAPLAVVANDPSATDNGALSATASTLRLILPVRALRHGQLNSSRALTFLRSQHRLLPACCYTNAP